MENINRTKTIVAKQVHPRFMYNWWKNYDYKDEVAVIDSNNNVVHKGITLARIESVMSEIDAIKALVEDITLDDEGFCSIMSDLTGTISRNMSYEEERQWWAEFVELPTWENAAYACTDDFYDAMFQFAPTGEEADVYLIPAWFNAWEKHEFQRGWTGQYSEWEIWQEGYDTPDIHIAFETEPELIKADIATVFDVLPYNVTLEFSA